MCLRCPSCPARLCLRHRNFYRCRCSNTVALWLVAAMGAKRSRCGRFAWWLYHDCCSSTVFGKLVPRSLPTCRGLPIQRSACSLTGAVVMPGLARQPCKRGMPAVHSVHFLRRNNRSAVGFFPFRAKHSHLTSLGLARRTLQCTLLGCLTTPVQEKRAVEHTSRIFRANPWQSADAVGDFARCQHHRPLQPWKTGNFKLTGRVPCEVEHSNLLREHHSEISQRASSPD